MKRFDQLFIPAVHLFFVHTAPHKMGDFEKVSIFLPQRLL